MLISTTEAAQLAGVARITIIKWIERGHLPAIKVGRDWVIERSALDTLPERKPGRPRKPERGIHE